ncbi:MAG: thiamine ABC transporter substrate-binding protein [Spirochaetes bacterium]|nr:thiamine ABC transporter substrate-binding protein [Spirochaetota bacterium]
MKKITIILLLCTVLTGLSAENQQNELTIYTYDSLSWIEKNLVKSFEQTNHCRVKVVKFENSSKIISRLIFEKRKNVADIAVGITPSMLIKAKKNKIVADYKSGNISAIKDKSLIFDREFYCTPFDFGALAVIYDPAKFKKTPESFDDILKMENSIIIQDPRTSSTGTDFLFWTIAKYGDGWENFWEKFSRSVLTAAPGWTESFSKFENGEAPMMVSYATDGAYSMENYKSSKYKAFIPDNEGFIQIEGVSIVKNAPNRKLAEKWIDFMLSDQFQKEIPLNQWMFPVTSVALPDVYKYAVTPQKILSLDASVIEKNQEKWLKSWVKIMKNKK